jgi:hypothetical protein
MRRRPCREIIQPPSRPPHVDYADRSVNDAHRLGREPQPTAVPRVEQERGHELEQLRLTQTIEEQERQRDAELRLAEEGREDSQEVADQVARCSRRPPVRFRPGQYEGVQGRQHHEAARQSDEHPRPRARDIAKHGLQPPGQEDQPALPRDHREAVERTAHADERRLLMTLHCEEIEPVRRDVVGR